MHRMRRPLSVVLSRFECGDGWDTDARKNAAAKILDDEVVWTPLHISTI